MHGAGHRVAITGLGVVAPCGIGKDAYWQGLLGPGINGTTSVTIDDWDSAPYYASPKDARRADRVEQYAIAAAQEAFAQAGDIGVDPARFGTIFATGIGGLHTLEEQVIVRVEKGERRVSPFLVPMMMANASGAAISMKYGLQGPNETICTACAAGTHAIGYAARLIAWGRCDAVATGGSECAATATSLAGFGNMTALSSTGRSMPFDEARNGFVMGEGAAVFVLERWDLAVARGATIIGEILGSASNADAHHITAPAPGGTGAIACMKLALDDAGLSPSDIRLVNAHGTSTPLNDAAEAAAVTDVFGARSVPVTSGKGVTGHALGAAGALEAAQVVLAMQHKLIPPTAGTTSPDPSMDIDLVTGAPREWVPGPAISNNFGFGGHNGSVIIGPA
ncbi:MAG: 3-oxoacyl-[acyl-carrier-protein] synthase [Actinomycetota bacterium]|jgi:3-oxoacyl-[acyl-carrier-protein] synthase II